MAIRNLVNTSSGLQNIAAVNSNTLLENYSGDPSELRPIRNGGNFDSNDVYLLLQQLIENDENLFAGNANLSLLFSEGILPKNDPLQLLNFTNTLTSFTIGTGLLIINQNFVTVSAPQTFTLGTGGWSNVAVGEYRADLIEVDTSGAVSIVLGTPSLTKPFIPTLIDRSSANNYPLYAVMVYNSGAGTEILHYQKVADFAGFDEIRRDEHVFLNKNDSYANAFNFIHDITRHIQDADKDYLDRLAGQSSNSTPLLETDANFPPEPINPLNNAAPNNRGLRHIPAGVWNNDSTSQPSYPDFIYPGENFKTNGFLYLPVIHGATPTDTVATIRNFKFGIRFDNVGDVAGVANEGIEFKFVRYPQFLFTSNDPLTYQLDVNSATASSITVDNANILNAANLSLDNGAVNQIIAPGDFILVSEGTGKGQSGKIVSVTSNQISLGVVFTTILDATSKIVIFKNNGGTPAGTLAWTAAQINADIITNETYGSITQSGYAADPTAAADPDRFIKIKKTGISINITKEKYYFMLTRVVREGSVLSDAPKIHLEHDFTNYDDTNVCNIYHVAEYSPPVGLYPVVDGGGDVFRLFDQFGDIASTFADRSAIYGGFTEWTLVAKDLNDYELSTINYAVDIPLGEAWVDVVLGRVAFNPLTRPESLYATYYATRFNSNKLNTKEIQKLGSINQSLEDYLSDKFPDNKNSGLVYIKKNIAANGDIIIPGGYVGIAFDDAQITGTITIEDGGELFFLNKETVSYKDYIADAKPNWEEEYVSGSYSLAFPEFKFYKSGTRWIRLTFTYNYDDTIATTLYEESLDSGATYSTLYTKNFAYSGGYLTGITYT